METIEEMKNKVNNNKKEIKKTLLYNILASCVYMVGGIGLFFALKDASLPVFNETGKFLVRLAFIFIGASMTASSNSSAVESIVNLKRENRNLSYEIEKQELLSKIAELEGRNLTSQEISELTTAQVSTENNHELTNSKRSEAKISHEIIR